jgi:hypothetical protein
LELQCPQLSLAGDDVPTKTKESNKVNGNILL